MKKLFSLISVTVVTELNSFTKQISLVSYYWLLIHLPFESIQPRLVHFLVIFAGAVTHTNCSQMQKSKTNVIILSFRLYKPFVACHACPCLFFFPSHFDNFFFRAIQTRNLFLSVG